MVFLTDLFGLFYKCHFFHITKRFYLKLIFKF